MLECLSYAGREVQYALEEKIKVLADYFIRFLVLGSEKKTLFSLVTVLGYTQQSACQRLNYKNYSCRISLISGYLN